MKFATKAIHAGQEPDPATGAIMVPIYQTSTYWQKSPGDNKGYEYSRGTNPTRHALENCLAALENARYGLAFSSGMGATDAVMKLLKPGDEVITGNDLYGGSYRMFTKIFANYGIKFHFLDLSDPEIIRAYVNDYTKLIWIETPTNPTMQIVDIEAVANIAKQHSLLLAVDNTFASPYLQNPMDLGADIVMHSVTKYIGGHSDVVMGALMMNDEELYKKLWFIYNACGATPGPMDSFLVLRGIKTLHLRMQAHCANGRIIAEYLKIHPKIDKVYWPGFEDSPGYAVAKKQMRDFGGMISIVLKDADLQETYRIASSFKVFALAESLGGVESLVNHPVSMTHGSIPKAEREKAGVVDNLLRLSVGVEDVEDLLEDIAQALKPQTPEGELISISIMGIQKLPLQGAGGLKLFLDSKVEQYNRPEFIANDPVSIPHLFTKKQDIEIMGFWAAVLAWGQRVTIINKCKELISLMDGAPYDFIMNHKEPDLKRLLHFKHRTFNDIDTLYFIAFFRYHYLNNESLESAFIPADGNYSPFWGLGGFRSYFFSLPDFPHRTKKHISSPAQKSSCKRLNMFLRWMVRKDNQGVDFGIWDQIKPSDLVCPCDLHVDRVARKLKLITRKQTDWQTAVELTERLKEFDPQDPVKYDFALFGLGIEERWGVDRLL